MPDTEFGDLLTDSRVNAVAAWLLLSLFALSAVESVWGGEYLWGTLAAVVGLVALLPAVAARDHLTMPPWEMVLLAGLPVVGRSVATLQVTSDVATYLSIAALALLVAINLQLFTPVEMSVGFAVLFVVVTTLAAAGIWAVARWTSDLYLGTELLLSPALTSTEVHDRLMWEFVASAVAGLVAGLIFEGYVRRRATVDARLPEEIA
jgi:hypothetical protein